MPLASLSRPRSAAPAVLAALLAALLAADLPAQPGPANGGDGGRAPVPGAEALAAARAQSLSRFADWMRRKFADTASAMRFFETAADGEQDLAFRYVLRAEVAALAERALAPALACGALEQLGRDFALDVEEAAAAALERMLAAGASPHEVAWLGAAHAERAARRDDDSVQRRLGALAARAAEATGDRWLRGKAADDAARAAELHAAFRLAADPALPAGERVARDRTFSLLHGSPETLAGDPLRILEPFLDTPLDADTAARSLAATGPEQLLRLSAHAPTKTARRGLRRTARELLVHAFFAASDEPARQLVARQLTGVTTLLADLDGVQRLRFAEPGDLAQLVIARGEWTVRDGAAHGVATETANYATVRYPFAAMRSVVVRGGIHSPENRNFRMAAGDVNLLLNWEVAPESHLWVRGERLAQGPLLLQPGKEHTIALHAVAGQVLVFVDDALQFTAPGGLAGKVTVYPALGSAIFVREILIDGELACAGPVDGPDPILK